MPILAGCHMHSTNSCDGRASIDEMVEAGIARDFTTRRFRKGANLP